MALSLRLGSVLLAMVVAVCGCGGAAASFDPTGRCAADGSAPGAYPDLEERVPDVYQGVAPELVDSGRNCSSVNLGSLANKGFTEIRFAGGTWSFGAERAAVLAVFNAPSLTADDLAAFYAESAKAASRTVITGQSTPTLAGRPGRRLDTKTGERIQTVVVWPAADQDFVNVVITNDLPDARIEDAVGAFGNG